MINRRQENYHRLQVILRWTLAVNLILVGVVLVLLFKNISLSRQVNELTARLETEAPSFTKPTAEAPAEGKETEAQTAEPTEPETTPPTTGQTSNGSRKFIVCLDAGHGGPGGKGAISTLDGRYESHDTLKLMLAVRDALQSYPDVTVVVTRDSDVEVDNGVRAQIANDAGADVFVSFHRNSNVAGDRGGIEGWIHSSNPSDSRSLGECILAAMEKVGVVHNCGVKSGTWDEPEANYKIIRLAEMPAVLLEVGYLNYARDNELFDRYYEEYAEAAAGAIYGWLRDNVNR